jgi:branched-chain amino acid transport system substrate-binding protein
MKQYFEGALFCFAVMLCLTLWCGSLGLAGASEPVKIALILSQTGIAAEENLPAAGAAGLAVEEINGRGGLLGRPLELILIDNKSTPLGSKRAAEEAVEGNVVTVIGAFRSSHSMPMARVLQDAGIPMIAPSSTRPAITLTGDYIFRACFIDSFQGRAMAQFAFRDLEGKTAAVLKNMNEEYSLTLAEYFVESFQKIGGSVLQEANYKGTAVDFTRILSETGNLSPDVLFVPGYSRDSGLIVKQAVNMGIRTIFLGGDAWGNRIQQYAGDALNGSYYSAQYHPDVPFEKNRHLQRTYREKYHMEKIRNMRIPLTYDSVLLFEDAVRRAASVSPDKIREALAATRNFRGATGTITFDKDGNPLDKEASILRYQDNSWVFVKSVRP